MAKQRFSVARLVVLTGVAILVAFLLQVAWAYTAQFPWSSDPWLMAIPTAIILAGLSAAVALVFLLLILLWKRWSHSITRTDERFTDKWPQHEEGKQGHCNRRE